MNILSINYIIWLIVSSLFFAFGEFLSKKFALSPNFVLVVAIIIVYSISVLLWLPAIIQKNQLSIVGTIWSVLSLLITVLIGIVIFKEKLNITTTIGIVLAIAATIFLTFEVPATKQNPQNSVCINNKCFYVDLAVTFAEQEKGLMYKEKLEENKGMFFIYKKEDIYSFWMKNTLIPLDIIWINKDNKVVYVNKNSQPCRQVICPSINPNLKAKYVLEINAGLVDKYNIKPGDNVEMKYSL